MCFQTDKNTHWEEENVEGNKKKKVVNGKKQNHKKKKKEKETEDVMKKGKKNGRTERSNKRKCISRIILTKIKKNIIHKKKEHNVR